LARSCVTTRLTIPPPGIAPRDDQTRSRPQGTMTSCASSSLSPEPLRRRLAWFAWDSYSSEARILLSPARTGSGHGSRHRSHSSGCFLLLEPSWARRSQIPHGLRPPRRVEVARRVVPRPLSVEISGYFLHSLASAPRRSVEPRRACCTVSRLGRCCHPPAVALRKLAPERHRRTSRAVAAGRDGERSSMERARIGVRLATSQAIPRARTTTRRRRYVRPATCRRKAGDGHQGCLLVRR
jgi:hypothetical protein